MDSEIEDVLITNNTDDLNDFDYSLTNWDIVQDTSAIIFTTIGFISNMVIIYMVARNARMRTKTNTIIMHIAINDALFLISNIHFLSSVMELIGANHWYYYSNCLIGYLDVGFQANSVLFILILVSNSLIKSKRIQIKWLLIVVYSMVIVNFLLNTIMCYIHFWHLLYFMCFGLYMFTICLMIFKEFNNCYKIWYKKDPLSGKTLFRLNIGRIYLGSWFFTFMCFMLSDFLGIRYFFFTIALNCFMTSAYILAYLVYADKNFKICFLNLLQCKGAGAYDVDATITFAEDSSDEEDNVPNNQVNINFNGQNSNNQTNIQNVNTIQVP